MVNILKKTLKYLTVFAWAVLFLYFYNILMPKNLWYFIIGIPSLAISSYAINKLFELKTQKTNV